MSTVDDFTRRQHELVRKVQSALLAAHLEALAEAARREVQEAIGPIVNRHGLHRLDEVGKDRPSREELARFRDPDDPDAPIFTTSWEPEP